MKEEKVKKKKKKKKHHQVVEGELDAIHTSIDRDREDNNSSMVRIEDDATGLPPLSNRYRSLEIKQPVSKSYRIKKQRIFDRYADDSGHGFGNDSFVFSGPYGS